MTEATDDETKLNYETAIRSAQLLWILAARLPEPDAQEPLVDASPV
jgi:hypothetical protein